MPRIKIMRDIYNSIRYYHEAEGKSSEQIHVILEHMGFEVAARTIRDVFKHDTYESYIGEHEPQWRKEAKAIKSGVTRIVQRLSGIKDEELKAEVFKGKDLYQLVTEIHSDIDLMNHLLFKVIDGLKDLNNNQIVIARTIRQQASKK